MKYIGSNYTISRSIGTGSGFEHAGDTTLPIFKASTPLPPPGLLLSDDWLSYIY